MVKYPIYNVQNFKCDSIDRELYVNTFSEHLENHSFVEEPHRHNSHLLLLFTKGSGTHEIDFDVFDIAPGSLFAMRPGQLHHWNLSDDIDGFVVIYSAEQYNLYFGGRQLSDFPFYASANKPGIVLGNAELKSILPYFELLLRESRSVQTLNRKMLNLIDCIHLEIAEKYALDDLQTIHPYNTKISRFETLLESHFASEKSPSFYAGKLHITLKHLNRICNEILNKTATEVIAARVILEMKRMLADKQLSISETADRLGFDDHSYFSRFFKKYVGISPTEFRNPKKS